MPQDFPISITMSQPDSVGSERRLASSPGLVRRVAAALERVEYRLALSDAERDAIFRLRHLAYVREGAIEPRPDGRFTDAVDGHANCLHLGVFVDGELAGAIRLNVTVAGLPPIPTAKVFADVLEPQIAAGRSFVDPTRFVADPKWSRAVPELMYLTLRLPWLATARFSADVMLAAVRPEHYGFYRRLWGNDLVSPPRIYPGLAKPVLLSQLDFAAARAEVEERLPFFRERPGEIEAIFGSSPI